MDEIYKICYVVNDEIKKMYVFVGENLEINDELYKTDPTNEIFSDIFDEEETILITGNNIDIKFVQTKIYLDDTIETIKKKYILAINDENITYSGLYFFIKTLEKLDSEKVYQQLSSEGKLEITKARLIEYLSNIDSINVNSIPVKDIYNYDDIFALDFQSKEDWVINEPLGQQFLAAEQNYLVTSNPFNVLGYGEFLLQNVSDILTTVNQNLLMQSRGILKNTIFACHVEDVLNYSKAINLDENLTIDIYFPYLTELNIESLVEYEGEKEQLKIETLNLISDKNWLQNINNVKLFYNINGIDLNLINKQGINRASILINPEYFYHLPLDLLFKLMNATKDSPLIKYNPGKNRENIYRLYAEKKSSSGKKFPYLKKSKILSLVKTLAKNQQLAVYISDEKSNIDLNFFDDGRIEINVEVEDLLSIEQLNQLLRDKCNPVIERIEDYLRQRGYNIVKFDKISDKNIEILDLKYALEAELEKKLNLKSIIKCLSTIFNLIKETKDETLLRFKKVNDYNEMDSKEAFIVETLNNGGMEDEVILGLKNNFGLADDDAARAILVDFVSRQEIIQERGHNKRYRKYKIKSNPGFNTEMIREKFSSKLLITIDGINNIGYLNTIPVYINSLMIITQHIEVLQNFEVSELCKGTSKVKDEQKKEDVIATVQQPNQIQAITFAEEQEEDPALKKTMLAMLLDDSEEDDSEEEEEEEDEEEDMEGGANNIDLTGLSLSNPNPIEAKLQKHEPKLFLSNPEKGFSSYSRSCPSSNRRQPIILTTEEKNKIDKEHPGSYGKSLSYKSFGETYHYICPRYWDLLNKTSLTQEEVESGKYGNVIPIKAKKVPPGGQIYQFDSKDYHRDENNEYKMLEPGFMKPDKHPEGKCMPCCFKNWDAPSQVKLRQKCLNEVAEETKDVSFDEYVKGPDKFPLENNRIGYLPLEFQQFLQIDNKLCQISDINTNIKENYPCIVRLGVEKNIKQSFIGAIAKIYLDEVSDNITNISIDEMKEKIIEALDIDLFITLQNGNLIDIFDNGVNVELDKYTESKIFKELGSEDPDSLQLFNKCARSYENYIKFLKSKDSFIDYKYLWDLLCFNNTKLFKKGMNLVILESNEDDITGNISLICPTNHYSASLFNTNKKTAIIIKKNNLYEPIISYVDEGTKYVITRRFSLKYKDILPKLRTFLETIKDALKTKCKPFNSLPYVYKFKTNKVLEEVNNILKKMKYNINAQLVNYNGKVIGVEVSVNNKIVMIPVLPSSLMINEAPLKWIDNYTGLSYEDTKNILEDMYIKSNKKLLCLPVIKVVDDNLIVGIITQTNQFVLINPPEIDEYGDDLVLLNNQDYNKINKVSLTNDSIDKERLDYIKKIKMETSFFNTFRNTLRIELGKYNNNEFRKEIEELIENEIMTYFQKIVQMESIIKNLLHDLIDFVEMDDILLNNIDEISMCNLLTDDKCNDNSFCLTKEDTCVLLIPKYNLINNSDNEEVYYKRIADELIRYNRIKSFILKPKIFLNFSNIGYKLNEDEIILLQSLIDGYFDDLTVEEDNKYIKYNTYDTVEPYKTQTYSNVVSNEGEIIEETKCEKKVHKLNRSRGNLWRKEFPSGSNEIEFSNNTANCTFKIIVEIYNKENKDENITVENLRSILSIEYSKLYEKDRKKILHILKKQGKPKLIKQLEMNEVSIADLIMNDTYFLSVIDIWILADKLKLPIVLFKSSKFVETDTDIIVCYNHEEKYYNFIKVPGIKVNELPSYKLIEKADNYNINFSNVSENLQSKIRAQENVEGNILNTFIEKYIIKSKKLVVKQAQEPSKDLEAEAPRQIRKVKKLKLKANN